MVQSRMQVALSNAGPRFSSLPISTKEELYAEVLRYIFRVTDAKKFGQALTKAHEDYEAKKVRANIMRDGRVLKNIKLYAYTCAKFPNVPKEMFGVGRADSIIVQHCLREDHQLAQKLRGYIKRGYRPLTPAKMDKLIEDVITEVKQYTSKFVFKKHRFITESEGEEADNIRQELYGWATYAIYKAYPRIESFLHAVNIAKTAIHNRGQNIIQEATTQSRQRLIKNEDGTFSSRQVNLDSMVTINGSGEEIIQFNYLAVDIQGKSAENKTLENIQDSLDLRMSLRKLNQSLPQRMRDLLKLWAGVHDEPFSVWLGQPNDEWFEQVDRKTYLIKCADFVGLDREVARNFYRSLQRRFIDYAPVEVQERLLG